jgi:hypothetical protein
MARRFGGRIGELVGPGGWWGLLSLLASGLAIGTLPNLAQMFLGDRWIGLLIAVVVGLGVYFWAEYRRRPKSGVGVVLHLYDLDDRDDHRVEAYQRDALRRHASCFVVNVPELLQRITVSDPVRFAFWTVQARLKETERDSGPEATEAVSFYLSARHQEAFWLGAFFRTQAHRQMTLMGAQPNRERPPIPFPAVRLDSRLETAPTAEDKRLLREVLDRDPDQDPEWKPFEGAPQNAPSALILAVAQPVRAAEQALKAAQHGAGPAYIFPGNGSPADHRCAGALVIRTGGPDYSARLPNESSYYEALLRYVFLHWQRCLDRNPQARFGWLFTDAPIPLATALGWRFRLDTRLVTHHRNDPTVSPG